MKSWKEENPVAYRKQQLKTQMTKLQRQEIVKEFIGKDVSEAKKKYAELEAEYKTL